MSQPATAVPAVAPGLPTAAIICIAIGAYVVLVVILLIVRQCLMSRGICANMTCDGACCGKEKELKCCDCWIAFAESCNCCRNPNIESCMDAVCPKRKRVDCAEIVMCQCCATDDEPCCGTGEPLCNCGNCDCACQCQAPECETINCCCFELRLKGQPPPVA